MRVCFKDVAGMIWSKAKNKAAVRKCWVWGGVGTAGSYVGHTR